MKKKNELTKGQKVILDNFIQDMKSKKGPYPFKRNLSYLNAHTLPLQTWVHICSLNDYSGLWNDIDSYLIKQTCYKK